MSWTIHMAMSMLLLGGIGCARKAEVHAGPAEPVQAAQEQPVDTKQVRNRSDLVAHQTGMVDVIGTYREVDVRKHPSGEPVYLGHVVIVLDDGTQVYLVPPWRPEAIRPEQERATHRNTRVVVTGLVTDQCPPAPSGEASIVAPCMMMFAGVMSEELHNEVRYFEKHGELPPSAAD